MKTLTPPATALHGIIEPLESRIAPAGTPLLPTNPANYHSITVGSAILLHAGDVLTTSNTGGTYLLYVQAGQCMVFTQDLNNNHQFDPNEITGIAAGDGLQLISFVDIHGDIVTDLNANGTLTDSDNNPATGPAATNGADGRVLLPSTITSITLRSLTTSDLAFHADGSPVTSTSPATQADVLKFLAPSSYSIFGNILAGGGLGDNTIPAFGNTILGTNVVNPAAHGLLIDSSGFALQTTTTTDYFAGSPPLAPEIGSILIGTSASGVTFNFGTNPNNILPEGQLLPFHPATGVAGGSIYNVRAASATMPFSIDTLHAGGGGIGAPGGSIVNVQITTDPVSGYHLIAGNGGDGLSGGQGGSIVNFSDLGSLTGEVVLRAGDGGRGLIGPGGAGGTITMGTTHFTGNVTFATGSGGDGFTAGGKGASFTAANIISVTPTIATAFDLSSSTRDLDVQHLTTQGLPSGVVVPTVGNTQQVDFNHDGAPDLVFSTTNPDVVEVVFGIPGAPGVFTSANPVVYLPAPAQSHIVIADFNNDGLPDIATVSGVATDEGIKVFLSNGDGTFTPALQSGLPDLPTALGYYHGSIIINSVVAGDFNGDGIMDLAVDAVYQVITPAPVPHHVILFMDGIGQTGAATPTGTGYFFANFARQDVAALNSNLTSTQPFLDLGQTSAGPLVLKATALGPGSPYDTLIIGEINRGFFDVVDNSPSSVAANLGAPVFVHTAIGRVDTNRSYSTGPNNIQVSLQNATLKDILPLDIDKDGNTDLAILTSQPSDFLITFRGNGAANGFTNASTNPTITPPTPPPDYPVNGDNSGIYFGDNAGMPNDAVGGGNIGGFNLNNLQTMSLRATDSNHDGIYDQIAVLDYQTNNTMRIFEVLFNGTGMDQMYATVSTTWGLTRPQTLDNTVVAWDIIPGLAGNSVGYAVAQPSSNSPLDAYIQFSGLAGGILNIYNYGYHISTGSGGNSVVGAGGDGGVIGGKLTTSTFLKNISAAIQILLPANNVNVFGGTLDLTSGNGGNGFTNGGQGGNIQGVYISYPPATGLINSSVTLTGGHGGNALTGTGGAGATLQNNIIITGDIFTAGDGGKGIVGGAGGSVIGNGLKGFFDTETLFAQVHAGAGGQGIKQGGSGGSINGFKARFDSSFGTEELDYEAGDGGVTVAGAGGAGGSIINSSPDQISNFMNGEIYLKAGTGGDGLTGGAGGSIVNFINSPNAGVIPTIASLLAGDGGTGVNGKGGSGGSISAISATAAGQPDLFSISQYPYVRIIAGNGGVSYGNIGGVGGSLINVTSTSQSSAIVGAAGRGGDGLIQGGNGGNVLNTTLNAAALTGQKVLVVAGDGGDVYAAPVTNNSLTAQDGGIISTFGHVSAVAGNGGSIINFTQPITVQTRVDLIAGNGGSTINYGSPLDNIVHVGIGGSITNVSIQGVIGNSAPNTRIKAYNDVDGDGHVDETMAQFITTFFRESSTPSTAFDDTIGNVGLVAGVAGRVKGDLPATPGVNGSVANVSARSIMSMVAGSVDSIAAIQSLSNIQLTDPNGVLGADKADPGNGGALGTVDYYAPDGTEEHGTIHLGGRLIDGAIVAKTLGGLVGPRVFAR